MTVPVRLRVCALVGRGGVEMVKDVRMPREPFVGQAVPEGRSGEAEPLFVAEVEWSTVLKTYRVRVEDDEADELGSLDAAAAAYERAGWREACRATMHKYPRRRRAAS